MSEKEIRTLSIDQGFRTLIRPLTRKEYHQLETNLLNDGCLDPIITWNGVIVDGHNRYSICTQYGIPFSVVEKEFSSREEAIAWICAQQLGRRNITDETRRFLIGMQYEAEKVSQTQLNSAGNNQYTYNDEDEDEIADDEPNEESSENQPLVSRHITAQRIAEENHISWNTVNKYATYSKAVEEIGKKVPEAVPLILSGRLKISHENTIRLSKMSPFRIGKVIERLEKQNQRFVQYKNTRTAINANSNEGSTDGRVPAPSVKDMPAYDPDAEITTLSLTIPTWVGTLERARSMIKLGPASVDAKRKLSSALRSLIEAADAFHKTVQEEENS